MKSFEDAFSKEAVLGAVATFSLDGTVINVFNEVLGTKFRVIYGYPGTRDIWAAMERGEIEGRSATAWETMRRERPQWLADHFIIPLVRLSEGPYPPLTDVPTALSFSRSEDDKTILRMVLGLERISRLLSAPPGLLPERLQTLRDAFTAMVRDPAFLEEADHILNATVDVAPYEEISTYIESFYAMSQVQRTKIARHMGFH